MSELRDIAYEAAAKNVIWPRLPIIMANTKTGQIVSINQSVAEMFGYNKEELKDKKIEILVPDGVKFAHERWRQDASAPKTRLMGAGRRVSGRRKDGSLFYVHVGLTVVNVLMEEIGVAFVVDLTGIVLADLKESPSGILSRGGQEVL